MADALRRAGRDHVARCKRREIRAEGDDLRHGIDQKIGTGPLHLLAVEPRRERQLLRIAKLVGGDHPGPERTGAWEILSRRHREFLIVAHAAVDEAGVARDVAERRLHGNVAPAAADDEGKLTLEIELLRNRWADQRALMAGQRAGKPQKHARLLRQLAPSLRSMGTIIDARAQNLFRIRNNRQPSDGSETVVRASRAGDLSHFRERVAGERLAQAFTAVAEPAIQADHARIGDDTKARFAIRKVARALHESIPPQSRPSPRRASTKIADARLCMQHCCARPFSWGPG